MVPLPIPESAGVMTTSGTKLSVVVLGGEAVLSFFLSVLLGDSRSSDLFLLVVLAGGGGRWGARSIGGRSVAVWMVYL